MSKPPSDIYHDIEKDPEKEADHPPAIPAATVLLLREKSAEIQVLMLHKSSKVAFGGLWVFPGGRIDDDDFPESGDANEAARAAAARETQEEAGIDISPEDFVWFAHWTPPPSVGKRFATWFFVTSTDDDHTIDIDGGEIQDHQWVNPGKALEQHAAGEIDLAPPTWVSLYHLTRFASAGEVIEHFSGQTPRYYQTRMVKNDGGMRVALWAGDAGYEDWNADIAGETHRLVMKRGGFDFLHSAVSY